MEKQTVGEGQVVVERALLEQMLESGERLLDGMNKIVERLYTMNVVDEEPIAPAPEPTLREPRVWDLSAAALVEYDADALVQLRADHRADHHEAAGCHVCDVLVRRLGSL